jgi:hypothetical protein
MLAPGFTAASAQQKACEVDEGSPNQAVRAYLDIQTASSAGQKISRLGCVMP